MKKNCLVLAALIMLLGLSACAQVVGPYYLEQRQYKEGIEAFTERLKENPDDASAAYYVGRYYLAMNKADDALPFFEKAVALEPGNADYHFWMGVTYWAKLEFDKERAAYEKAIALDPDHISAHLYLGHGFLDRKQWERALAEYDTVIELDRYNPEALYNRAVALKGLGKDDEEVEALRKFLKYYPDGSLAMRATVRLNLHGDFSYRNFILGKRNVTLTAMTFKPQSSALTLADMESLNVVGAMMKVNKELDLHIVAFVKGDAALAKARAASVKKYIMTGYPDFDANRLLLSWFDAAEIAEIGDYQFPLDESVKFITSTREQ